MDPETNPCVINYLDADGNRCRVTLTFANEVVTPTDVDVGVLRSFWHLCNDCESTSCSITQYADTADTPTDGSYEDTQDKAMFVFVDANNKTHNIKVPAPKPSIFLADKVTVDLANAAVALYTSLIMEWFCTEGGVVFTAVLSGRRIRAKGTD